MSKVFAGLTAILFGWILINLIGALIVGAIARKVLPGSDQMGWPKTILIGFLGGIIGKFLAFLIGWRNIGLLGGFLVSIVGAIGLLLAHRAWRANKAKTAGAAPKV